MYNREIYLEKDNFTAYLEWYEGSPIIHIDIKDKTSSSFKDIKREWEGLKEDLRNRGYKELYTYIFPTEENRRLCAWLDKYEHIGTTEYIPEHSSKFEVLEWEL